MRLIGGCLIPWLNPMNVEQIEAGSGSLNRHPLVAISPHGRPRRVNLPDPATVQFKSMAEPGPPQCPGDAMSGASGHPPLPGSPMRYAPAMDFTPDPW